MEDDEMAKFPWLERRGNGRWYLRVPVPPHLVHVVGAKAKRPSLGTSDLKIAKKLYRKKLGEIEAYFDTLEAQLAGLDRLDRARRTGELADLRSREIGSLVREWWQGRTARRAHTDDTDWPDTAQEILELREGEREPTDDAIKALADQLLVDAGFVSAPHKTGPITTQVQFPVVDRDSAAYRELLQLVARGMRIEAQLADEFSAGSGKAPFDPLFNPQAKLRDETGPRNVEDLIRGFCTEREAEHGVESTARKYDLLCRMLREIWGPDLPLESIDRDKVIQIRRNLEALPPNSMKRFPRHSLQEAILAAREANLARLAPNTVNSYMQSLLAMLRWAEGQNWGVRIYARDLVPPRRPQVKGRGFTADELRTLFRALAPFRETDPAKFWVPALAVYTGARAGELCQLHRTDIRRTGGIAYLDFSVFHPDTGVRLGDKSLKTDASERQLPLHQEILDAGFLSFVEASTTDRLFPNLVAGPKGDYAHNFSKWFGRFKKRLGFDQPSLVFHSFRHGFRDACRDVGIPEDLALALGGWAAKSVGSRYGARGSVQLLHREIAKVAYGDFSLSAVLAGRNGED